MKKIKVKLLSLFMIACTLLPVTNIHALEQETIQPRAASISVSISEASASATLYNPGYAQNLSVSGYYEYVDAHGNVYSTSKTTYAQSASCTNNFYAPTYCASRYIQGTGFVDGYNIGTASKYY